MHFLTFGGYHETYEPYPAALWCFFCQLAYIKIWSYLYFFFVLVFLSAGCFENKRCRVSHLPAHQEHRRGLWLASVPGSDDVRT